MCVGTPAHTHKLSFKEGHCNIRTGVLRLFVVLLQEMREHSRRCAACSLAIQHCICAMYPCKSICVVMLGDALRCNEPSSPPRTVRAGSGLVCYMHLVSVLKTLLVQQRLL